MFSKKLFNKNSYCDKKVHTEEEKQLTDGLATKNKALKTCEKFSDWFY